MRVGFRKSLFLFFNFLNGGFCVFVVVAGWFVFFSLLQATETCGQGRLPMSVSFFFSLAKCKIGDLISHSSLSCYKHFYSALTMIRKLGFSTAFQKKRAVSYKLGKAELFLSISTASPS